jgi:transposase-like protein
MKWPSWLKLTSRRKPAPPPSLTQCPKCGAEMTLVEKTTFSGNDMRTYRCDHCREEHVVDYGVALWKVLSDARESDK